MPGPFNGDDQLVLARGGKTSANIRHEKSGFSRVCMPVDLADLT